MTVQAMKTRSIAYVVSLLLFVSFARADVSDATNLDQGWRLWLDPKAAWQDDTLYLPEDVNAHEPAGASADRGMGGAQ